MMPYPVLQLVVMDIAPQGLVTGSNPGWTNPWESDIPEKAIDNLIDVRFMASLGAQVRIQFRFVKRVWLCGFFPGDGLVWSGRFERCSR